MLESISITSSLLGCIHFWNVEEFWARQTALDDLDVSEDSSNSQQKTCNSKTIEQAAFLISSPANPRASSSDLITMSPTSVKPPFTAETALMKVKAAQDLWNSRDPARVATAYTEDSIWRNRDHFFVGREAIIKFLTDKWAHEHNYKLKKELFTFSGNKM